MDGGGGNTTTTVNSMPPWIEPYATGYLDFASQTAMQPYTPYDQQRVADLSPLQQWSIQGLGDLAGGTDSQWAANDMLTQTLQGGFQNPFAQNQVGSGGQYQFDPVQSGGQYEFKPVQSGGQYQFDRVTPGWNQYMGENPYFRSQVDRATGDITRNYERAIVPERTRQMALARAFGGSAHQESIERDQENLARQLGDTVSGMYGQQYDRSTNLAESGLNRLLGASQFNASLGNQAFESAAQRGLQSGQFNAGLGNQAFESAAQRGLQSRQFNANLGGQAFENAAQRGLQSGMFNANLGSQSWEGERNRQMQAVQGATGLANGAGQNLLNALQGGDIERRQNQSLLDSLYGDFREWRDYPDNRVGLFGNALGSVLGRAGGSQTTQGPGYDPVSQGMGMLMLANGMGGKGGGGSAFSGASAGGGWE